ncbi:2-keto-4-pentenoate hydratase/2-oxohepta-3-ene-1,7-dioic acid hydratase in catechol pathway [Silvibacterium bohemicum]|uniref:2-keto-4-pentenoate hydratase/2-oxohepta-3-ene-1,7-dioic acid hydratase in catechol pathway n=1 Tax=Silvibacterium bohemicum TaxID=1577686 RepID=A0A841JY34_9BACT|nr:fumarylacetoacetate hydrolase family protein [Silvibacterium bohemicum]MBB6146262.1 2-keto-4-pentenoate hydratase/2-oxohepta-3-ene-1,7-dioic acid hydratase in catechol pathway [Silvibacterium bohemicum]
MKYCRFETAAGPQYGQVEDRAGTLWIERLLPPFEEDPWTKLASEKIEPVPMATVKLLSPVVPRKILCIGRNYRDHAAELGNDVPKEPLLFLKPGSAVIGPEDSIRIPPQSQRVDFEGELAIVIGKKASQIGSDEDVSPYIRGYTIVNDVTARDLQKSDGQWSRAKGFDTFCPVGPLVTDEIDLKTGVTVETRLNDEVKQHGHTRDLIFPIDFLLRYITAAMTLYPGDLIPTGTPAGVAPMRAGDRVEVRVEGIGMLANPVR